MQLYNAQQMKTNCEKYFLKMQNKNIMYMNKHVLREFITVYTKYDIV